MTEQTEREAVDMSGISLSVDPDLTPQGGTYKLYVSRIMTITAKLVCSDDFEDGEVMMVFTNVTSMAHGAPNAEVGLAVYSDDPSITIDTGKSTASVPIIKTGFGEGYACLPVLVIGYSGHTCTASASAEGLTSQPLTFSINNPTTLVPVTYYGTYIPISDHDMVPSEGAFIHYQFNIVDSAGKPLNRMRVRLSGRESHMAGYWITQVLVYPSHDSRRPLDSSQDVRGYYVDLVTDELGYAEAFVCPRKGIAAAGEMFSYSGGHGQSAGLFFIADLKNDDGLPMPYPNEPIVNIDEGPQFLVNVPHYDGAADNDIIYLFCNGKYQGFLSVEDHTLNPIGSIHADVYGLYSITYDQAQPKNVVEYIAVQATDVLVSDKGDFLAKGTLKEIHPEAGGTDGQPAEMPSVPESEHGALNCKMIASGIRVRVPLAGLNVQVGDVIDMEVYVNGFRQWPDKGEPYGAHFGGPIAFTITPRMLSPEFGYAEWWFQSSMLSGFGRDIQDHSGTFEALYTIIYGRISEQKAGQRSSGYVLYRSATLPLEIDTIPPGGMNLLDSHANERFGRAP